MNCLPARYLLLIILMQVHIIYTGTGAISYRTMQVFVMRIPIFCIRFHLMHFTFICVVVSITFNTNGDSVAGSEFSITATINISEIVDVLALTIRWSDSSGNEQNFTVIVIGMLEPVPSGPVVSTLDLTFSSLTLSQAGAYSIGITIFDHYGNNVSVHESYLLIIQSKL